MNGTVETYLVRLLILAALWILLVIFVETEYLMKIATKVVSRASETPLQTKRVEENSSRSNPA